MMDSQNAMSPIDDSYAAEVTTNHAKEVIGRGLRTKNMKKHNPHNSR